MWCTLNIRWFVVDSVVAITIGRSGCGVRICCYTTEIAVSGKCKRDRIDCIAPCSRVYRICKSSRPHIQSSARVLPSDAAGCSDCGYRFRSLPTRSVPTVLGTNRSARVVWCVHSICIWTQRESTCGRAALVVHSTVCDEFTPHARIQCIDCSARCFAVNTNITHNTINNSQYRISADLHIVL